MSEIWESVGQIVGKQIKAEEITKVLNCSSFIIISPGDSLPEKEEEGRCRIHVDKENKFEGVSFG